MLAPLDVHSVGEALRALTARLTETGAVEHPDALEELFDARRIRDVIHVGGRVLLPHLRTEAVPRMTVALGVTRHPVAAAPDDVDATAQIVILVLAPPSAADLYLQTVAAFARVLRRDDVVEALVRANSPEEVLRVPGLCDVVIPPRLAVRDVMTPRVHRVYPHTPVREVLRLVSEHQLHAVPVVGEEREVLGIVTDRDLLRHLLASRRRRGNDDEAPGADGSDTPVREIMSRSVMCITEDQGLTEVAGIMVNKDVERLPVVSDGRLTGFLTRGDIIRKLFGS
ncbi:MAG: CBS domain-containing protein [Gemmatimonadota bacterium]|nr:CBS domain-containing protein [Gemmatimonadota bacterium]